MLKYRYTLDSSLPTKLFYCPQCGKKKFKRYVDNETKTYLPERVGRCNRQDRCGYHLTAKAYFAAEGQGEKAKEYVFVPYTPPQISYMSERELAQSMQGYGNNHFVKYLQSLFPQEKVIALIQQYQIATSKYWQGATIFWQRDEANNIRAGKIMLYKPQTGKRVKEPFDHIRWVHKVLKKTDFHLQQCLFGEHLISENQTKTVAIVESEKTAIIATAYCPDCIWLACGSMNGLTVSKMEALKGRKVILYPDLGKGYETWQKQAKVIRDMLDINITVSDILEKTATDTERENGLDIADYLIKCQYKPPEIAYTNVEIWLSEMVAKNPIIAEMIERYGLYNPKTSKPYRIKTD